MLVSCRLYVCFVYWKKNVRKRHLALVPFSSVPSHLNTSDSLEGPSLNAVELWRTRRGQRCLRREALACKRRSLPQSWPPRPGHGCDRPHSLSLVSQPERGPCLVRGRYSLQYRTWAIDAKESPHAGASVPCSTTRRTRTLHALQSVLSSVLPRRRVDTASASARSKRAQRAGYLGHLQTCTCVACLHATQGRARVRTGRPHSAPPYSSL